MDTEENNMMTGTGIGTGVGLASASAVALLALAACTATSEGRVGMSVKRDVPVVGVVGIEFDVDWKLTSEDVHWGEINRQRAPGLYPLHDVTASGINQDWDIIEPSSRRVGPAVAEHNVGWIEIDWDEADPAVRLMSMDLTGAIRNQVDLRLSELAVPGS
ncbi:hypothetical protein OAO71_00430 [Planctomycetota bacterium]|nr:hypothetical protein [Planctomycetota bacterium]